VYFQDGTKEQKKLVEIIAQEWLAYDPNLLFKFDAVSPAKAHIRITFKGKESWSYIGTTAQSIPFDRPTMTLVLVNNPREDKRTILHEFGHALGLLHEHQSPTAQIKWNRPEIVKDVDTAANIDSEIIQSYIKGQTDYTKFDQKSIMMYPIPSKWTLNGESARLLLYLSNCNCSFQQIMSSQKMTNPIFASCMCKGTIQTR
jgi:hypothetical protein